MADAEKKVNLFGLQVFAQAWMALPLIMTLLAFVGGSYVGCNVGFKQGFKQGKKEQKEEEGGRIWPFRDDEELTKMDILEAAEPLP